MLILNFDRIQLLSVEVTTLETIHLTFSELFKNYFGFLFAVMK